MLHLDYKNLQWQGSAGNGIEKAVIWENEAGGGTRFWKVPKGAGFPNHTHKGYEHIYVVKGVMDISGAVLKEGDFLLTVKDEEHEAKALEDSVILVMAEKKNS